ncbi:hypothetical protein C8R47DRAFT_1070481 [Mycena vitilis]|nr:hypothetical protein C8R47DRAFT_1070481 [Mycena vitilis]
MRKPGTPARTARSSDLLLSFSCSAFARHLACFAHWHPVLPPVLPPAATSIGSEQAPSWVSGSASGRGKESGLVRTRNYRKKHERIGIALQYQAAGFDISILQDGLPSWTSARLPYRTFLTAETSPPSHLTIKLFLWAQAAVTDPDFVLASLQVVPVIRPFSGTEGPGACSFQRT